MIRFLVFTLTIWALAAVVLFAEEPGPPETTPEQTQGYKQIEMICPVDGTKVPGHIIEVFASAGTDRDFCQSFAGKSLYELWVSTCPTCGYSGYVEDFSLTLQPDVKQKVLTKIKASEKITLLSPWDKYWLTGQIYQWRKARAIDIGNVYLRGTCSMRGTRLGPADRVKEKVIRAEAIKFLRKAEKQGQFPLSEIANAKYLIGELYRRNEQFDKAIRYYEDAMKIKTRPAWLDEWVIRQTARAIAEVAD
jgi:Uncharacterized protein conserved in bacteria (DUF2225)